MFIEAVKFVCFLFNAHRLEGILVFAVIGANFALQGLLFLISLPIILSILVSQGHSHQCTESFMCENVMDELKQMQPEDESKKKMLDFSTWNKRWSPMVKMVCFVCYVRMLLFCLLFYIKIKY